MNVKTTEMNGKSKKVVQTEKWVDSYIKKNGFPPTYEELKNHFGLSRCAAWNRCNKFRSKMKQIETLKRGQEKSTKIKLEYFVPNENFEQFVILLTEINKLLKQRK